MTGETPRLLYLMHVDARWIKQRPHFLAQELRATGRWQVTVRYVRAWRRSLLADGADLFSSGPLPALPPVNDWVRWRFNAALGRLQLSIESLLRPVDMVWVTHPRMWAYVPTRLRDRVVYDAMDIASAFPDQDGRHLRAAEAALCSAARVVLCSSTVIQAHLAERYGRHRTHLVPNALGWTSDELSLAAAQTVTPTDAPPRLVYFGTISQWLDVQLLLAALERFPALEVLLIGPLGTPLPAHPRLTHQGPVPHRELPRLAASASALIMPFTVTDLVRGVDPVKLYEYIALGKPVITCWYPALDRFAEHVHFYRDDAEFFRLVESLLAGTLQAGQEPGPFLAEHTWTVRAQQVADLLAAAPSGQPLTEEDR